MLEHELSDEEKVLIETARAMDGKLYVSVGYSASGQPRARPSERPYPPGNECSPERYHLIEGLVSKGILTRGNPGEYILVLPD